MPALASSTDDTHQLDPVDIRGSHAVGLALTRDRVFVVSRGGQVADGATGVAINGEQVGIRLELPFDSRGHNACGICVRGNAARLAIFGIGTVDKAASAIHVVGNEAYLNLYDSPAGTAGRVAGGGTGIWISGGRALILLRDRLAVEGAGSRGVLLKGRSSRIYRTGGDMQVSDGATGIEGLGDLVWATLQAGTLSVRGNGSTGLALSGSNSLFDAGPGSTLNVSDRAVGLRLVAAGASLAGRVMVAAGATAVQARGEPGVGSATVVNEYGASLVTRGPATYGLVGSGVSAGSKPMLVNRGLIDVDPAFHETGQPWPDLPALGLPAHELGFGLSVSAPLDGTGQIHAVNEGSITVRHAGAGMVASRPGASVTNRGLVSLLSNADSPPAYGNLLYAMVALNGGSAINDDIGVIEVNTAYGKAFFADAGSTLVNRGTVRLYGSQMAATHPQMGLPQPGRALAPESNDGLVINSSPWDLSGNRLVIAGADQNIERLLNTSELRNGSVLVGKGGGFTNEGTLDRMRLVAAGSVHNTGSGSMTLSPDRASSVSARFINSGAISLVQRLKVTGVLVNQAGGKMLLSQAGSIRYGQGGSFVNHSFVSADHVDNPGRAIFIAGHGNGVGTNTGVLIARGGYGVMSTSGSFGQLPQSAAPAGERPGGRGIFINQGLIDFTADRRATSALYVKNHAGHDLLNDHGGIIVVRGNKAVAMRSDSDSQLVNRGTIHLGEKGTTDTGMTAMMLRQNVPGAIIVNETSGIINVHARRSYAFELPQGGRLINRGLVRLLCGDSSCSVFRDAATRAGDISGSVAAIAYQFAPRFQEYAAGHELRVARSALAGYVIGTRPDGGAGTLSGGHLDASGVTVDTGFVAGTAARQARFAKVLRGEHIDGIGQIRSRSAAWQAQAWRDADGDVGVTLTKNDYRELAPDAALRPLAAALEQDYDGSELFRSLELGSVAEIGHALRQLSGAGIRSALKPLQTLEQRFVRLGHDMAETRAGFGLQLVGSRHGRPEARLGGSAYDLVVLRQRFAPGSAGQLTARYGFASIRPGATAADAGLDGHSQLFGLDYAQPLGRGPTLEGEFRYAQHRFDTRRTLRYGSVDLRPQAGQRRDRFSGQLALALAPQRLGGLTLAPLLGLTVRHQRDAALTERNAGIYGLRLSAARASAVEGVFGLRVRHEAVDARHGRGWRVDAELLGRPVLYRQAAIRQARFASLPGGGWFTLPADRARFAHDVRFGVSHQGKAGRFDLKAHAGREDGMQDRGITGSWMHLF
ncbi:autotransporter domain-containing protein [Microvirgula aerodenitrificans]|uniref:autotransporter domain-containing protein n=1 Tax=Microvirgula aerodenitrificans TaxID=57480 RepID=UPI002F3EA2B8